MTVLKNILWNQAIKIEKLDNINQKQKQKEKEKRC